MEPNEPALPRRDVPEFAGRRALVVTGHPTIGRAIAARLEEGGADARLVDKAASDWRDEPLGFDEVDLLIHDASSLEETLSEDPALYSDGDVLQQACLGPMQARGFGRIVHVTRSLPTDEASRLRRVGGWLQPSPPLARRGPNFARDGLRSLVRGGALVVAGVDVTVNLVEVGALGGVEGSPFEAEWRGALLRHTPRGAATTPAEIAEAVAFLASPRSGYVTGAVVPATGGLGLGLYPEQYAAD